MLSTMIKAVCAELGRNPIQLKDWASKTTPQLSVKAKESCKIRSLEYHRLQCAATFSATIGQLIPEQCKKIERSAGALGQLLNRPPNQTTDPPHSVRPELFDVNCESPGVTEIVDAPTQAKNKKSIEEDSILLEVYQTCSVSLIGKL